MSPSNPHAMHTAIIWIEVELHEMMPTGECSGNIGKKIPRFPVKIVGTNLDDALRKANTLLSEIKEKCNLPK